MIDSPWPSVNLHDSGECASRRAGEQPRLGRSLALAGSRKFSWGSRSASVRDHSPISSSRCSSMVSIIWAVRR